MKLLTFLLCLALSFPLSLIAQADSLSSAGTTTKIKKTKKITLFELFSQDTSITKVTLTTNLDSLEEHRYKEIEVPSVYSYVVDGEEFKWSVKVSPRGKSRKKICGMPPFLLNFSKKELKKGNLKKHDKLKLVSYCKSGKKYEAYLFREYLIYKIYNILNENSFNVKLLNMTYAGKDSDVPPVSQYSFLIENTDEMAARLKAKEIDKYGISGDACSKFDYHVLCLFQYMVSNTDWSLGLLHNTKLIQKKKTGEMIPVPYDFDYSGLVNADYSVPNPDYLQLGIRHRVYIGDYPTDEEMEKVFQHFKDKKEEVYALIDGFELLDKGRRKSMKKYLKKFYKDLDNPKRLKRKCLSTQKIKD